MASRAKRTPARKRKKTANRKKKSASQLSMIELAPIFILLFCIVVAIMFVPEPAGDHQAGASVLSTLDGRLKSIEDGLAQCRPPSKKGNLSQ